MPLPFLSAFRLISIPVPQIQDVLSNRIAIDSRKEKEGLKFASKFIRFIALLHTEWLGDSLRALAQEVTRFYNNKSLENRFNQANAAKSIFEAVSEILPMHISRSVLSGIAKLPYLDSEWFNTMKQLQSPSSEKVKVKISLKNWKQDNAFTVLLLNKPLGSRKHLIRFINDMYQHQNNCKRDKSFKEGPLPVLSINSYTAQEIFGPTEEMKSNGIEDVTGIMHHLAEAIWTNGNEDIIIFINGVPKDIDVEQALCGSKAIENVSICFLVSSQQELNRVGPLKSKLYISSESAFDSRGCGISQGLHGWSEETRRELAACFDNLLDTWRKASNNNNQRQEDNHTSHMCQILYLLSNKDHREDQPPQIALNIFLQAFLWSFCMDSINCEVDENLWMSMSDSIKHNEKFTCLKNRRLLQQHYDVTGALWKVGESILGELTDLMAKLVKENYHIAFVGCGFHKTALDYVLKNLRRENDLEILRLDMKDLKNILTGASEVSAIQWSDVGEWEKHMNPNLVLVINCTNASRADFSLLRDLAGGFPVYHQKILMKHLSGVQMVLCIDKTAFCSATNLEEENYLQEYFTFIFQPVTCQFHSQYLDLPEGVKEKIPSLIDLLTELHSSIHESDKELYRFDSIETVERIIHVKHFDSWERNIVSHVFLPLTNASSKTMAKGILCKHFKVEDLDEILKCSSFEDIMSTNINESKQPMCVLGHFGLQKSSKTIKEACKQLGLSWNIAEDASILKTDMNHEGKSSIIILKVRKESRAAIMKDLDKLLENHCVIMSVDFSATFMSSWKPFVETIKKKGFIVVGVPDGWTEVSRGQTVSSPIRQIHDITRECCEKLRIFVPNMWTFALAQKVAESNRQEMKRNNDLNIQLLKGLLVKVQDYSKHVQSVESTRSKVQTQIEKEEKGKLDTETEEKALNIELQESKRIISALDVNISDLTEQQATLEADKVALMQKASMTFDSISQQIREEIGEEEINLILANQQYLELPESKHIGAILAVLLDAAVPTEEEEVSLVARLAQLKSSNSLEMLLANTNPLELLHPCTLFLQAELRELEDLDKRTEGNPLPEVLLSFVKYFESINEMLSYKDDYSEINVRLHECELQLSEHQRRQDDINKLQAGQLEKISKLQEAKINLISKIASLKEQEAKLTQDISVAAGVASSFKPLADMWTVDLEKATREESQIPCKSTLHAAALCYFACVPQDHRQDLAVNFIQVMDMPSLSLEPELLDAFTPWNPR